jgi:hypothetical protein
VEQLNEHKEAETKKKTLREKETDIEKKQNDNK